MSNIKPWKDKEFDHLHAKELELDVQETRLRNLLIEGNKTVRAELNIAVEKLQIAQNNKDAYINSNLRK